MRLIDADKLREDVLDLPNCYNGFSDTYDKAMVIDLVDEQPTIEAVPTDFHDKCQQLEIQKRLKLEEEFNDAEPIRHGHWVDVNGDGSLWRCSVCGETQCCDSNYCGDCGAKMDEVK